MRTTPLVYFLFALVSIGEARLGNGSNNSTNTSTRGGVPNDENDDENAQTRIVGGEESPLGAFPFFAQGAGGCGGSLIWKDIVLTAAHCNPLFDQGVFLGVNNVSQVTDRAEFHAMADKLIHPSYSNVTNEYDFMLIKLDSPYLNPWIQTIELNRDTNHPSTGDKLTVMGFGATDPDNPEISNELRNVTVDFIDYDKCSRGYGDILQDETMLCAGSAQGGLDSCYGDSGGPLVDESGVQVGVVSFGIGCAQAKYPGVYARVSSVIDWIEETICSMSVIPPDYCGEATVEESGEKGSYEAIIEVVHDDYPKETAWQLLNSRGKVVAEQKEGTVTEPRATVRTPLTLTDGNYTFHITDKYGDGFCCSYGTGSFRIYVDDQQVVSESGEIGHGKEVSFVAGAATSSGVQQSTEKQVSYRVEFQYDKYPEETGFSIEASTGDVVFEQAAGAITEQTLLEESLDLQAGETYTLKLTDTYGDGICCGIYGNGWAKVYATVDGDDSVLAESDGLFELEQKIVFTVPTDLSSNKSSFQPATGSPLAAEQNAATIDPTATCTDTDQTFFINHELGEQNCTFLQSSGSKYDYFCRFVDVVIACPYTCNRCDLFS